ncbi:hypothetical protein FO488_06450 [Geobacter sp. FeAm09]|uniref:hypothetical protein n=1 Tax=Geobacter sp. FeAm09 TaxID=2597769 RepID=UPI0011EBE57B|nr:hypothetical protein [Geobacter sp. FeAm09]QEM67829.1 hypothetical protein FO488_06450 [Geobacter sp. FeAm09]
MLRKAKERFTAMDEKTKKRIEELIAVGEQVLATKRSPGEHVIGDFRIDANMAYLWATSVQHLLVSIFGQESEQYRKFSYQLGRQLTFSPASRALAILKSVLDDCERDHGHLAVPG